MRASGILLHPTSLPGGCGIGELGDWACRFADFLAESGMSLWQVLPLGPPGFGNSPYQSLSSMAGNPLLISLQALAEEGWISSADLEPAKAFPAAYVDFGAVMPFKIGLLKKAAHTFFSRCSDGQRRDFEQFCAGKSSWLDRFAEYVALKEMNAGATWTEWRRTTGPHHRQKVLEQKFIQFQFFRQWSALKKYCNERGIRIVGDVPFFVAHDSADVWASPELFDLDETGRPRNVAGVPPDYFSATGQLWGNPLYRWDMLAETGYRWWIDRIRGVLELVDLLPHRPLPRVREVLRDTGWSQNGRERSVARWTGRPPFRRTAGGTGKTPFHSRRPRLYNTRSTRASRSLGFPRHASATVRFYQ